MAGMYYTLVERDDVESPWCIAFGDYNKSEVEHERDDMLQSGMVQKSNLKIISSGERQCQINAAVAKLNNWRK